ncbi:MAG: hypothetical protein HC833_04000 [Leptolyngbyaceae cyanobacterium RM1_406_9]|nr:hypothetical protein [Leptolyngbyaceae cyanobacterium RM1_406_9]
MARVLILVDAQDQQEGAETSVELAQGIAALKLAIATFPVAPSSSIHVATEILTASLQNVPLDKADQICPLMLNLPDFVAFPGQETYCACQDISEMRRRVEQLGYLTGTGQLWLPIVLTARGALYGEVIGAEVVSAEAVSPTFFQPLHLSDRWRQALYWLGQRLLRSLSAPPATYLLQFGFEGEAIYFDRLLPFPAAPAIASLGVQSPDLFACHWLCISNQPILDLKISSNAAYRVYEPTTESVRLS